MKYKHILTLVFTLIITCSLAGCNTSKTNINSDGTNSTESESTKIEEQINNGDVLGFEKNIEKTLKTLNTSEQSETIDNLITTMHAAAYEQSYHVNGFNAELEKVVGENDDLNIDNIKKKASSYGLKGIADDIKEKHLILLCSNNQYFVVPDLQYVLDKYSQYMSDELKDMVTFRNDENINPIYSDKAKMINLTTLAERELKLEDLLNTYSNEDSEYYIQWITYQAYYIDNLFGETHKLFFTKDGSSITSYAMNEYKNIIEKYPQSQLGKLVSEYLALMPDGKITENATNYANDTLNKYNEKVSVAEEKAYNKYREENSEGNDENKDNNSTDSEEESSKENN